MSTMFLLDKWGIFYYTYTYDNAPSPSGKAGDFDSPIACSTHAGATEDRLLKETFGRRSLCFAAASGAAEHFAGGGAVLRENRALRGGLRSVFVRCFVLRMPEAMPEVGWDDPKIMEKISYFLSEIFFFAGNA